ncbi:beta-N-acetylhexosaminidase [Deinococcus yavapaiensis]|uniref:Beta-N-acetylhexosaminidase n=1 Tax=Deinococcus yavapaiensis KR-236 TaxID=694435 RepID=A0A318SJN9_9DEIO|nr:beta-N-acetylhexosaminidase [Deinococcus yavapaiensis]PYE52778.1 beta-N-acetylhexosaminidase [Deinococcus yavapaiensis KR-236]
MTDVAQLTRLLVADLPGPTLDDTWRRHFETHRFGGVCLFRRNIASPAQLHRLVTDIREVLGEDALIAVDQEGGAVLRLLEGPLVPAAMAIGAVGDDALSFELGAVAARGLLAYGINWNYAPVLDVNNNPLNPVIGERSFGEDPAAVARLGVAWALGSESAGVLSAVKHFPGHGDTSVDSHLDLPVVRKSAAELEACEWRPFREAVRSNVGSFMTAHILYPDLDPEHPATLSPTILTRLLRDEWKYDGLVVTDATDMRAIAERHPNGEGAALALVAGADMVLACTHGDLDAQVRQVDAVHRAARDGRLTPERTASALRRVRAATARFPGTPKPYDAERRIRDEALASEAARRAITAVGSVKGPRPDDRVLLVVPGESGVGGPYGDSLRGTDLADTLRVAFPRLQTVLYDAERPEAAHEDIRRAECDFTLFATTSRWKLSDAELTLAKLTASLGVPTLHLALWNPYHVAVLPLPALVTYGFRDNALVALRNVLLGTPASGRLPVTLPATPSPAR